MSGLLGYEIVIPVRSRYDAKSDLDDAKVQGSYLELRGKIQQMMVLPQDLRRQTRLFIGYWIPRRYNLAAFDKLVMTDSEGDGLRRHRSRGFDICTFCSSQMITPASKAMQFTVCINMILHCSGRHTLEIELRAKLSSNLAITSGLDQP